MLKPVPRDFGSQRLMHSQDPVQQSQGVLFITEIKHEVVEGTLQNRIPPFFTEYLMCYFPPFNLELSAVMLLLISILIKFMDLVTCGR